MFSAAGVPLKRAQHLPDSNVHCILRIDSLVLGQVMSIVLVLQTGTGNFDDVSYLQYHILANRGELHPIVRLTIGNFISSTP